MCDDVWGPLSWKGRGTPKFFQKSVFRVGIDIGTRYATAGPYMLWCIYCGVYTGVCIGAVADSVVFPAGSAYRCTVAGEGSEIFSKIAF